MRQNLDKKSLIDRQYLVDNFGNEILEFEERVISRVKTLIEERVSTFHVLRNLQKFPIQAFDDQAFHFEYTLKAEVESYPKNILFGACEKNLEVGLSDLKACELSIKIPTDSLIEKEEVLIFKIPLDVDFWFEDECAKVVASILNEQDVLGFYLVAKYCTPDYCIGMKRQVLENFIYSYWGQFSESDNGCVTLSNEAFFRSLSKGLYRSKKEDEEEHYRIFLTDYNRDGVIKESKLFIDTLKRKLDKYSNDDLFLLEVFGTADDDDCLPVCQLLKVLVNTYLNIPIDVFDYKYTCADKQKHFPPYYSPSFDFCKAWEMEADIISTQELKNIYLLDIDETSKKIASYANRDGYDYRLSSDDLSMLQRYMGVLAYIDGIDFEKAVICCWELVDY